MCNLKTAVGERFAAGGFFWAGGRGVESCGGKGLIRARNTWDRVVATANTPVNVTQARSGCNRDRGDKTANAVFWAAQWQKTNAKRGCDPAMIVL